MYRSCSCFVGSTETDKVSTAEAIDLINSRIRNITVKIASIEHKMRTLDRKAKEHVSEHDLEKAKLVLSQIGFLRKKRTRYLGCNQKLWQMCETLNEQDTYVCISETFKTGVNTMESLLQQVILDDVENMMDTMEEHTFEVNEIGFALNGTQKEEEPDIEDELEELMDGIELVLPDAPTFAPQKQKKRIAV